MAQFNPRFWEVPTGSEYLESFSAERALWFETEEDRRRRYAFRDFFQQVLPVVVDLIDSELTTRQREVLKLYFFSGKSQEDIAAMLELSQSTVSRHLFGTVRDGKKVGGAIQKLRKLIDRHDYTTITEAMGRLEQHLAEA